jgi:hypothetical protein
MNYFMFFYIIKAGAYPWLPELYGTRRHKVYDDDHDYDQAK